MENLSGIAGKQTDIENINKIPMLFVLGNARSGTTLLQILMDANPFIVGGPESKFAITFYPYFKNKKIWEESDIIDFVNHLYIDPLFVKLWHLDKQELTEALLPAKNYASYSLLCKMVYYQMRNGKDNILYLSDKNPEYILHIDTILKIFPDAKFIHIVREPRDTIYSQILNFKEKNSNFKAHKWVAFNSIVEERKKEEPDRYFTIKYETLVNDTESIMKSLCDYLKIPFAATMSQNKMPEWLNAHLKNNVVSETTKPFYANLLKPVNTTKIEHRKTGMDPYDQTITQIITGNFARKMYGYEIDSNKADKPIKISLFTLLRGKAVYYAWQKI